MANSSVSPQEKFEAAVRVIQSLPKNGSFQPSHEMMLRFYALYKQAKCGSCTDAKPAFWDVVRKAKWDAWKKLENVPSETAMILYVEELKKVIETMPHTPDVSAFLEKLGSFYELVDEDEVPVPQTDSGSGKQPMRIRDSIKLAASKMNRSRGNSDSVSNGDEGYASISQGRQMSPQTPTPLNGNANGRNGILDDDDEDDIDDDGDDVQEFGRQPNPNREQAIARNGDFGDFHQQGYNEEEDDDDDEDDEFCDVASSHSLVSPPFNLGANVENGLVVNAYAMDTASSGISQQIINSLNRLENDVHALSSRLDAVDRLLRSRLGESSASSLNQYRDGGGGGSGGDGRRPPRPWWWQLTFDRLALRNVVFIVVWPLVVQFLGRFIIRRLKSRTWRRVRALPN